MHHYITYRPFYLSSNCCLRSTLSTSRKIVFSSRCQGIRFCIISYVSPNARSAISVPRNGLTPPRAATIISWIGQLDAHRDKPARKDALLDVDMLRSMAVTSAHLCAKTIQDRDHSSLLRCIVSALRYGARKQNNPFSGVRRPPRSGKRMHNHSVSPRLVRPQCISLCSRRLYHPTSFSRRGLLQLVRKTSSSACELHRYFDVRCTESHRIAHLCPPVLKLCLLNPSCLILSHPIPNQGRCYSRVNMLNIHNV